MLRRKEVALVKIQRNHRGGENMTWEPEREMRKPSVVADNSDAVFSYPVTTQHGCHYADVAEQRISDWDSLLSYWLRQNQLNRSFNLLLGLCSRVADSDPHANIANPEVSIPHPNLTRSERASPHPLPNNLGGERGVLFCSNLKDIIIWS
ncbi:hypothetical protein LXL04_023253 [Taraxacum kok-saghyz]